MTPLAIFIISIILLFITGFYSLLLTRNLIRIILSLEVVTKGLTLLLILAGRYTGDLGSAQSFAIILIVVEVVVIAVAAGIALGIFRHNDSLDTRKVANLKG
ncbi:MAG: NADH-quinone oxidoreductase subunit K [Candidatus Omnitrophota bacterium]